MPLTVPGFLSALAERRMWLRLGRDWKLKLLPSGSRRKLSRDEQVFLFKHDAELKTLAAAAPDKCLCGKQPEAQPRTQPQLQSQPVAVPAQPERVSDEPELYARGTRITEAHVREAMEVAGDLHDYEAGRISKLEAYERARVRLRQLQDLYGVR